MLKYKEEFATCSQNLEEGITKACNAPSKLNIVVDAGSIEKIQKLVVVVKDSKDEIGRVQFELQLKILEFQLKFQPITMPSV